jgi:hypothetical protein
MDTHPALIKLHGGLVGGPDQTDTFPDIRNDYQRSEVAFDYNAGFTGAAAGLAAASLKGFNFAVCGGNTSECALISHRKHEWPACKDTTAFLCLA